MSASRPICIATRGSALALAQSNLVRARCEREFPEHRFELKVIKTTGDRLQTINLTNPNQDVTKGLFTKELEVALLAGEADFAVHSLKDLPTELPAGLKLGAVTEREDPRDVLIYRDAARPAEGKSSFPPGTTLRELPAGATVATSSTRRQAQVLALRPDLKTVPIRGNVGTRVRKLLDQAELDATILALAGLNRLNLQLDENGRLTGENIAPGCIGVPISLGDMIPCVGQAALGIESRADDPRIDAICERLNHPATFQCVTAERAFLREMGGGCLSPVAAHAIFEGDELGIRAISFRDEKMKRAEARGPISEATRLGREIARKLSH